MTVEWRLRETLETAGITVYALAEKMGGATRRPALYNITSPDLKKRPRGVSFDLIDDIANALFSLTGKIYSVCDILEYKCAAFDATLENNSDLSNR